MVHWFPWFLEWYPGVVPGYLIRVPGYVSCLLLPEVVPGSLGLVGYLIRGLSNLLGVPGCLNLSPCYLEMVPGYPGVIPGYLGVVL